MNWSQILLKDGIMQFHCLETANFIIFCFDCVWPLSSEPTATTSQTAKDNSGHKQFGRELYDLPKNGHIPSHYDLLPSREAPPSGCTEADSEWVHRRTNWTLISPVFTVGVHTRTHTHTLQKVRCLNRYRIDICLCVCYFYCSEEKRHQFVIHDTLSQKIIGFYCGIFFSFFFYV